MRLYPAASRSLIKLYLQPVSFCPVAWHISQQNRQDIWFFYYSILFVEMKNWLGIAVLFIYLSIYNAQYNTFKCFSGFIAM